jgi:hypothetical protein
MLTVSVYVKTGYGSYYVTVGFKADGQACDREADRGTQEPCWVHWDLQNWKHLNRKR